MRRNAIPIFLLIEALLYLAFMGMDLFSFGASTVGLKYSGILICLLFSLLCALRGGDRLVPPALFMTALADLFLLVLGRDYLAGLLFFLAAQTIYLIRLYRKSGKIWLLARLSAALLGVIILFSTGLLSLLNLAAVLYFSLLLINMALSWMIKTEGMRLFAFGLTLFVLCDICVGIFNLGTVMPSGLHEFSGIGMWLFYLPSQVLISLSCTEERKKI